MKNMNIVKVAGALGAEVHGVDLRQPLSTDLAGEIRQALLENLVIFFRDQDLSPAQFMQFAQAMGQPVEYPFVKGLDGYPQIIEVKKLEHERTNFGGVWHSDTTYLQEPPMGSMLLAREIPPYGGDTLFANQYMAWDTLSDTLKQMLRPLKGISTSATMGAEPMGAPPRVWIWDTMITWLSWPGPGGTANTYSASHGWRLRRA